jgi:GntR family transcriptional repressor for pyruvate dehydrogenase complex
MRATMAIHPPTRRGDPARPLLRKAADVLAERIRRQIVRGELRPGALLPPEAELLDAWHVGRPALREALRILESEALIEVRRGNVGGALVTMPTVTVAARSAAIILQMEGTPLEDIYEARLALEPGAAYQAARRAVPDTVGALGELLRRERAAVGDAAAWAGAAVRFHEGVVAAAGVRTLALFSDMLAEIIDDHQAAVATAPSRDSTGNRELASRSHGRLLELVEANDAEGARQHWYDHIAETNARYFR